MENDDVRNAIGRRLAADFPHWSGAQIHALATQLAATRAYDAAPDGSVRPTGNPQALAEARRISPDFVTKVSRDTSAHLSPAQRTIAQWQAMGLDADGDDPDKIDDDGIPLERGPDGAWRLKGTPPEAA